MSWLGVVQVLSDGCWRPGHYLGPDVVESPPRVMDLYHVAVTVHVNEAPQLSPRVHSGEEHTLVLAIDPEHHIAPAGDVVIHHRVLVRKLL